MVIAPPVYPGQDKMINQVGSESAKAVPPGSVLREVNQFDVMLTFVNIC